MPLFPQLKVWTRAHQLVLAVYGATAAFPADERFGLVTQMRRPAFSVPANIAEGQRRTSDKDFAHFLDTAEGSLAELQYFLLLSRDLGYVTDAAYRELEQLSLEVERMLASLNRRVREGKRSARG